MNWILQAIFYFCSLLGVLFGLYVGLLFWKQITQRKIKPPKTPKDSFNTTPKQNRALSNSLSFLEEEGENPLENHLSSKPEKTKSLAERLPDRSVDWSSLSCSGTGTSLAEYYAQHQSLQDTAYNCLYVNKRETDPFVHPDIMPELHSPATDPLPNPPDPFSQG